MAAMVSLASFLKRLATLKSGYIGAVSPGLHHHVLICGSELIAVNRAHRESVAAIGSLPGDVAVDFGKDVLVLGADQQDFDDVGRHWSGPTGAAVMPWPCDGFEADPLAALYAVLCYAAQERDYADARGATALNVCDWRWRRGVPFGLPVTAEIDRMMRSCQPVIRLEEALGRWGTRRCVLTDVHGLAEGLPDRPEVLGCVEELSQLAAAFRGYRDDSDSDRHAHHEAELIRACHRQRLVQQARLERHLNTIATELRTLGADAVWRTGGDGLLAVGPRRSMPAARLEGLFATSRHSHISGAAAALLRSDAGTSTGLAWLQFWLSSTKAAVRLGRSGQALGDPNVSPEMSSVSATSHAAYFEHAPMKLRLVAEAALRNAEFYAARQL